MSKSLRNRILLITAIIAAAAFFAFPLEKKINLGLDLKGGMHLILKVETEKIAAKQREDAVLRAIEILRNRIDSIGVGETLIQRQGENQILVQLPGVTDRDAALAMIGQVALLEFRMINSNPALTTEAVQGKVPEGYTLQNTKDDKDPVLLSNQVAVKGEMITDARVGFDQFGQPNISFSLNSEGTKQFAELTKEQVGERLAIVVDGVILSAPNIREPILTGTGEITGQFSYNEASQLALQLRSGALPAPMVIEEERTIGPLLGKDSIRDGINATVYGAAAVFLFMVFYYLKSGFVANIALALNIFLILGAMGFLRAMLPEAPVTLTLPGIAGIILTLGMAVDANVLINERIREEIANGRPIGAAINSGYNKAFSAIFDSNVTTLIAAFMLFQFGSGPIKGFAVTLTIGLLTSLFTALVVTKAIFHVLLNFNAVKSLPMLQFFHNSKIDFISKRYFFYVLSIGLVIAGIVTMVQKKDTMYGIDFAGGQIQEYRFAQAVNVDDLRGHFKEAKLSDVIIQQFEKSPETLIVRSSEDTYNKVVETFKAKMPDNSFEVLRIEKVGPIVGKVLRERALLAIVCALGGILIYVAFRFKHVDFAAAGVIALLHDVFLGAGILVMMGRQIDLLVVTALLTIAGYSINDTIVIYDRVRENMAKTKRGNLAEIINLSLNQTFSRTILTTSVTLLVVISLYLFGGEVLNSFALCLLIGFVCGSYSTIFIASPLVLAWHKKS